jgi:predicted DNA-binding transcriptional regulator AlpA
MSEREELVPDTQVRREFGNITPMTLWRWETNPRLGFPKKIKIGDRNFRLRSEVEAYKQQLIQEALDKRRER